jgi:hypothetical protein
MALAQLNQHFIWHKIQWQRANGLALSGRLEVSHK